MKWFDLHTHQINSEKDVLAVVDCPSADLDKSKWYSLSLHPWTLNEKNYSERQLEIKRLAQSENVLAIGECGLDKLVDVNLKLQIAVFSEMIEISEEFEKPLIVHCVKAFDELLSLRKKLAPRQQWIIHGFRGNKTQAEQLISKGLMLSFGPKLNEEALKIIPLNRMFIETDDNEISILEVYKKVASSLDCSINELKAQIWRNANEVFGIDRKLE